MEYREDIGFQIRTLSHLVKRTVDQVAFDEQDDHPTGVQGWILGYLYENQGREIFQRDIQEQFSIRRSTVTGILQLMEKKGIIRRESVASDARLKSLVPTERAAELDAQVRACLRETDRMLTRGLSDGQVQLFKEMAAQMSRNLDNWENQTVSCPPADTTH